MPRFARWTSQDDAVLSDLYPREGVNGAADALPDRSWHAIQQRAHKLRLKSPPTREAPKLSLTGDRLEQALRWHEEDGWSCMRIARELGINEQAASNAILAALSVRRGYRPAERDATGRLTAESKERLRFMLKKGLRHVEIQLRLGLSASRVSLERRRYDADLAARGKAPLPPPGAGEQYSGVKIPAAKKRAVEALLMEGHGSTTAARQTGVSVPSAKNIRTRLIKRLTRAGKSLPGCDSQGRRVTAAKASSHYVAAAQEQELRRRLLAREPVAAAARASGVGSCNAYRIRDRLREELAANGRQLPTPIRHGRGSARRAAACGDDWLPADRQREFRQLAHDHGFDEAKRILIERVVADRAAEAAARAAERARPKTFEEQLAIVASGRASIVPAFRMTRAAPDMTLGGVASGAI